MTEPQPERSRWRVFRRIASPALILAAAALAVWIVVRESEQLRAQEINFKPGLLVLSFLIAIIGTFIAIAAWRRILRHFGIQLRFRQDVRVYGYSAVALVLPGGIWPIVSRTALYQRHGARALLITIASLVETLVIGVAGISLYALATLFRPDIRLWARPEIGALVIAGALTLMHPRIFGKLVRWGLARARQPVEIQPGAFTWRELGIWIGLQMLVLAIGGLAEFCLLLSLVDVGLETAIPVIAAWAAATAAGTLFFWAPGTPIIRDGAMVIALSTSLPTAAAIVFIVAMRLWGIASLLIFAAGAWLALDLPVILQNWREKRRLDGR